MTEPGHTDFGGQHIVVGIDRSVEAVAALRWAATEAKAHGLPLTVVHVKDPLGKQPFPIVLPPDVQEIIDGAAETVLDEALSEVYGTKEPAGVTRVVTEGNPAEVLIEAAKDASMLVVGARGGGPFTIGSVSDRSVRHAPGPVVVVR